MGWAWERAVLRSKILLVQQCWQGALKAARIQLAAELACGKLPQFREWLIGAACSRQSLPLVDLHHLFCQGSQEAVAVHLIRADI